MVPLYVNEKQNFLLFFFIQSYTIIFSFFLFFLRMILLIAVLKAVYRLVLIPDACYLEKDIPSSALLESAFFKKKSFEIDTFFCTFCIVWYAVQSFYDFYTEFNKHSTDTITFECLHYLFRNVNFWAFYFRKQKHPMLITLICLSLYVFSFIYVCRKRCFIQISIWVNCTKLGIFLQHMEVSRVPIGGGNSTRTLAFKRVSKTRRSGNGKA